MDEHPSWRWRPQLATGCAIIIAGTWIANRGGWWLAASGALWLIGLVLAVTALEKRHDGEP